MSLAAIYKRRARDGVGFVLGAEVYASDLRSKIGERLDMVFAVPGETEKKVVTLWRGFVHLPEFDAQAVCYAPVGQTARPSDVAAAWLAFVRESPAAAKVGPA
jgi:hypothetical protein